MSAYYSEHEPFAAAWLRNLIAAQLIAPGEVDERNIQDVKPEDLKGFTQCHFFAGIGVWSYALRQAGWPDDLPAWTGSCPCQPFSLSGKRKGFSDERHLWPFWFPLIRESRPGVIFGEQVASDDGLAWLDLVSSDLEGQDYTLGAVDICAAGFGAPMQSQRLYFVAEAAAQRRGKARTDSGRSAQRLANGGKLNGLAAPQYSERRPQTQGREDVGNGHDAGREEAASGPGVDSEAGDVAASNGSRQRGRRTGEESTQPGAVERSERLRASGELGAASGNGRREGWPESARLQGRLDAAESGQSRKLGKTHKERLEIGGLELERSSGEGATETPSPVNGFWKSADWLYCRDDKYRPVEPGTFPLVNGAPARVGRLRGYGNALCAPQAESFIRAYMQERESR